MTSSPESSQLIKTVTPVIPKTQDNCNVVIYAFAVIIEQKGVKLKKNEDNYYLLQEVTGLSPYFSTSENKPTENSVSKKFRG
jgi:hypothetical protein